jgi:hypothetical protein
VAQEFEAMLSAEALYHFIEKSELLQKQVVLLHFDEIFERFVLNRGVSSGTG